MINREHVENMKELNEFIKEYKENYEIEIEIINISSTESGYDLFYIFKG